MKSLLPLNSCTQCLDLAAAVCSRASAFGPSTLPQLIDTARLLCRRMAWKKAVCLFPVPSLTRLHEISLKDAGRTYSPNASHIFPKSTPKIGLNERRQQLPCCFFPGGPPPFLRLDMLSADKKRLISSRQMVSSASRNWRGMGGFKG